MGRESLNGRFDQDLWHGDQDQKHGSFPIKLAPKLKVEEPHDKRKGGKLIKSIQRGLRNGRNVDPKLWRLLNMSDMKFHPLLRKIKDQGKPQKETFPPDPVEGADYWSTALNEDIPARKKALAAREEFRSEIRQKLHDKKSNGSDGLTAQR